MPTERSRIWRRKTRCKRRPARGLCWVASCQEMLILCPYFANLARSYLATLICVSGRPSDHRNTPMVTVLGVAKCVILMTSLAVLVGVPNRFSSSPSLRLIRWLQLRLCRRSVYKYRAISIRIGNGHIHHRSGFDQWSCWNQAHRRTHIKGWRGPDQYQYGQRRAVWQDRCRRSSWAECDRWYG